MTTKYVAAIRDTRDADPIFLQEGGGFTPDKQQAKQYPNHGKALEAARKKATTGQLYYAKSIEE